MEKKEIKIRQECDWEQAAAMYFTSLQIKGDTLQTIDMYEEIIRNYFIRDYVNKKGIDFEEFKQEDWNGYILFLKNKGIQNSTINIRIRTLRAFFNFLLEENIITNIKVKTIREEKKTVETFSELELKKLVEKPKQFKNFAQLRDYVMVLLFLGTGVRMHTLCTIKIEDVNLVSGELKLTTTKNRREQVVPLAETLKTELAQYINIRGGEAESYLICNTYGGKISEDTVRDRLNKYCSERLGDKNGRRYNAHKFRHTFSIMYLRKSNNDILTLQKLLGHSQLETTRRYANLLQGDVIKNFKKSNPLDNIFKETRKKAIKL